ncbi:MAG: hypothetical protein JSS30_01410 [Verrucomicrobia bacterium]|nr:hypothetical protein [Verrucomicrobiota bacterium]
MNSEKRAISVLLGPVLMIGVVSLLLLKISSYTIFWLLGVVVAVGIAGWVSYLAFLEIISHKKELHNLIAKKDKESLDLRAILDETHLLYREKVSKLEIALCENERLQADKLLENETRVTQLAESLNHYKNLARSFETSLEEALAEVRALSELHYLDQQQRPPKNLVKQHAQLREQFEEKSVVLDQTRRRLFEAEGALLSLKKERGFELLSQNEEIETLFAALDELIKENEALEQEIKALEGLVSLKASAPKKTQKRLQEILEFQFEPTVSAKE